MANIYVASSWRNLVQPSVVKRLRDDGHTVYDFKNPPDRSGFSWREIDTSWHEWSPRQYIEALKSPQAQKGYRSDFQAMLDADIIVLVLPCGASAHSEAGWAAGRRKGVFVLITDDALENVYDVKKFAKEGQSRSAWEPELMYKMFTGIVTSADELSQAVNRWLLGDESHSVNQQLLEDSRSGQ